MKNILLVLYNILPSELVFKIASIGWLKPLRDKVLREKEGQPKLTTVPIDRLYGKDRASFHFRAPYKVAMKAKKHGVESAALRNSIHEILKRKPNRNAVVFDVGTNYGFLSSVWALLLCKNGGKVYSFEPVPIIADAFRDTIELNKLNDKIEFIEKGVGKEKGVLEVSINNLKEMQIEAEVVPLDDFILENKISQCDLVKIDTDGNDYNVLLGAEKSIDQFRPIIVIETNGLQEILNFLTSKSYELFDVQLVPRSEWDVLPKNLICIPR